MSTWEGQGAQAAKSAMTATAADHDAVADSLGTAANRMESVHRDAEALAETIKRILDDAAAQPAVVVDESTNQVIAPDTSHMTEEYAAQVAAKVIDLQERIADALADGERIDTELAGAITTASGERVVKTAGSLEEMLLPATGERRDESKPEDRSAPKNLDEALDRLTEGGAPAAGPVPLDPAKVEHFKKLARETMLREGVPPEQIEQRLDAMVAAAQKPLSSVKAPERGPTPPKPSFEDGFADGWFGTEESIKDLIGANGWEDLKGSWTDLAKGTWERVTNPIDSMTEDVEHLTKYPGHYLGEVAGGTALTAPSAMFGGEAALAARAAIPDDVIDMPSHTGAVEHAAPLGDTHHQTSAVDEQSTSAVPDFSHLPDTGPYPLPEPAQLTTPSDGAFFWSGRGTDGMGIGPITAGGNGAADLIADASGATTLEALLEREGIQPPRWSPNDVHAENWWSAISQMYAENSSGEVHGVIGSNRRPGNVWETVELPRLMENPGVTKITVIDPDTGIETIVFQR